MALPEDLVNRALDAVGCSDQSIGSITQGTTAANAALRHYIPCLEQLLRGALWNFARKEAPLQLLAAQAGYATAFLTPSGTPELPQVGNKVIPPWIYEYAWPTDCIAARFVPFNHAENPAGVVPGNNNVPPFPPTTAGTPFASPAFQRPVPMLVASDNNYPLPSDATQPPSEWWNVRGQAIDVRKVILTNQPCANLVYTVFQPYPNMWDPLFEQAFVSLLATFLALPCNPDKKEARALRAEQIGIAKGALGTARVRDGDEGWPSVAREAEWIAARRIGAGYGGFGWGAPFAGQWFYGWEAVGFGDGSVY